MSQGSKSKTGNIKLLEERGEMLQNILLGQDFFCQTPKAQAMNANRQMGYSRVRSCCAER